MSSDKAVNDEVLSVSPMLSGGVLQLGDWYTNLISCTSFGDFSSCFLLVVHSKRSLSIADKYALSSSKSSGASGGFGYSLRDKPSACVRSLPALCLIVNEYC